MDDLDLHAGDGKNGCEYLLRYVIFLILELDLISWSSRTTK
jgi:hypothetical protein